MKVLDIDGEIGAFAIYDEPANAPSDAPLYAPLEHLDVIKLHSELDYLQVYMEITATINFPAVGRTGSFWDSWASGYYPLARTATHTLANHNLGYVPKFIVAESGGFLSPGFPIQQVTSGQLAGAKRRVSIFATNTQILMRETATSVYSGSGNALGAITRTFRVLVLREMERSGNVEAEITPERVRAGRGAFDSDYSCLREVSSGESPYFITSGRNIDTDNGNIRTIDARGNIVDDVHSFRNATGWEYTGSFNEVNSRQVSW